MLTTTLVDSSSATTTAQTTAIVVVQAAEDEITSAREVLSCLEESTINEVTATLLETIQTFEQYLVQVLVLREGGSETLAVAKLMNAALLNGRVNLRA